MHSKSMSNLDELPEGLTAKEAALYIADLAVELAIPRDPPSLRTLRLWRSKGWLSKSERSFTRRNLLEALGIMRLGADGVTNSAAAQKCLKLDEERLLSLAKTPEVTSLDTPKDFARITLDLLARGVLEQYRQAMQGAVTGLVRYERGGVVDTPLPLRQAMARLGRLYWEEGCEDHAASVHEILQACMTPFSLWAPGAISSISGTANSVLIDPEYRVPSEDCETIAQQADGANLDDLIEHNMHSQLMQAIAPLGNDAHGAYTTLRGFVARHPLATIRELHRLYANPELPNSAIEFVRSLYVPVHVDLAMKGTVSRCYYCNAPVDRDDRCLIHGCREDHPQVRCGQRVRQDEALVARPEVLKYWVDPAREELRLFDSLRRSKIAADLYPFSDRCDVAIGDVVGVDVKDYRDPSSLARKLNLGIGGLAHYRRRIIAVADRRTRNKEYTERLREQLLPYIRQSIEVRSVSDTIHELKIAFRPK